MTLATIRTTLAAAAAFCLPAQAVAQSSGVVSGTGRGYTQIEACNAAKSSARGAASVDAARTGRLSSVRVTGFGSCTCNVAHNEQGVEIWNCSVDATWTN